MPVFERRSGAHVAERIRAAHGSQEEARLSALAEAGLDNWVRIDDEPADPADDGPPNRTSSKGAWVAYAIRHEVPQAEADSMTRDQLADRFLGPKE